jgi:ribose/xylose/arabinose/galactoside ABC-type transport system permease subunit
MKKNTTILFAISIIVWIIGSVMCYQNFKNGKQIVVTGLIIVIAWLYRINKERKQETK